MTVSALVASEYLSHPDMPREPRIGQTPLRISLFYLQSDFTTFHA